MYTTVFISPTYYEEGKTSCLHGGRNNYHNPKVSVGGPVWICILKVTSSTE